jgi:GNAT superfamily N-acetyltransferase
MELTYQVQPFTPQVKRAYERLLPEQTTMVERGKLDWKFAHCPAGVGVLALARQVGGDADAVVGVNAFQPARLKIGNQRVLAFQSMDTIVDPVARGKGVFTRLIEAFYGAAPELGAAVLYGVPNDNSAPGFFNKLGWTRLGSPPFLIKPLRAGYFARRLLGGLGAVFDPLPLSLTSPSHDPRFERIERFGPDADALWEVFSRDIPCAVDRTHDMLNWRFVDHPAATYETLGVRDGDGGLRAFVTWHLAGEKHGGSIGYIMEAMSLPGAERDLKQLLNAAVGAMRVQKADAVLAWSAGNAPNHSAFRRAGFWPMPEKIRPIILHFGGRALSDEGQAATAAPDAWYLSYFDSDTV